MLHLSPTPTFNMLRRNYPPINQLHWDATHRHCCRSRGCQKAPNGQTALAKFGQGDQMSTWKKGWCQQIVVCMIINQILLCNLKAWLNNFECIPHDIISSFPPPSGAHRQNYPPLGQDFAAARWVIMRVAKKSTALNLPLPSSFLSAPSCRLRWSPNEIPLDLWELSAIWLHWLMM